MNKAPFSMFPNFVRTREDQSRWKASLNAAIMTYGLILPRDIDMLQMLARGAYDSDISTKNLFDLGPDAREADGERLLEAMRAGQDLVWIGDDLGGFSTRINRAKVLMECESPSFEPPFVTPSATGSARLCYLMGPIPPRVGQNLLVELNVGSNPSDHGPEQVSSISVGDGKVQYWNVRDHGATLDERSFDRVIARALIPELDEDAWSRAQDADTAVSEAFAAAYARDTLERELAELDILIGDQAMTGASRSNGGIRSDYGESLVRWLVSRRHGCLVTAVAFADLFPNRDAVFAQWF
jgi:hypothetical protein